ncbi:MBL fold metallo-hydrolase [Litchfieldia alkalitelluris]|uniref:MBL fold metallo-hydrolase n=1 Tax=Litchfieldia alkalitelluris TaxID=304268 RepID=UPI000996D227|nr:MBL fold metallo-hydrolase [Litchfieldia alkalitelluris]
MKVTIIGYWGGFPAANEASSGYLFEHDGFRLLVDCGSGVLSQLQNYVQLKDIDAVILSHYHHDHIADIGPLQYARLISTYLHKETSVLPIYGHHDDEGGFDQLQYKDITKAIVYQADDTLQIGPFSLSFMKTKHPAVCYAMKIEVGNYSVVYTADSSYMDEFIHFSMNADLLLCECNLYGDQDGSKMGHMTSVEAGKIAHEANVKQLILTHLPHYGEHTILKDQASTLFSGPIALASSGFTWEK